MTAVLLGTLFVAVTIGVLRLHPFLALTLGAILAGSLTPSQLPAPERVFAALEATGTAFGDLVGAIGIAIALAAIIGDCLLRSGAADRIAGSLLAPVRRGPGRLGARRRGLRALDPGVLRHRVLPA